MPASQSSVATSSASLMSAVPPEHGQCTTITNNNNTPTPTTTTAAAGSGNVVLGAATNEPDAFDAIISQLTALGTEIDQELAQSHCHNNNNNNKSLSNNSTTSTLPSTTSNNNSGAVPTTSYFSPTQQHQQHQQQQQSMEKAAPSMMYYPNNHAMYHHYQTSSHATTFGTPQQQQQQHHHQQHQQQHAENDMNSASVRTDSPDNDSAFSDSISLISSEQSSSSSSSSSRCGTTTSTAVRLHATTAATTSSSLRSAGVVATPQQVSCPVMPSLPPLPSPAHCVQQDPAVAAAAATVNSAQSNSGGMLLTATNTNNNSSNQQQTSQHEPNSQRELFVEQQTTNPACKDNISSKDESALEDEHDSLASIVRQLESFVGEVQTRLCALQEEEEEEEEVIEHDTLGQGDKVAVVGAEGPNEQPSKEEIIQRAIDKIREANFRKLYIKVFTEDNSAKSILADERMTISDICQHLAEKNHIAMDISQCIIEHMPQLYLERFFEDHESLIENILHWDRVGSTNKMFFSQRLDKYDMFYNPEKYLLTGSGGNSSNNNTVAAGDEKTLKKSSSLGGGSASAQLRADLINNFFRAGKACAVPEIEGILHLRSEGKKVWKKYFFTLRSSGLYYCLKGRPKSTKDLICLITFEMNCLYYGFGWRKKYKAPNDYGFAIKHPQVQSKSPKQIKYLCAETEDDLRLWTTGIRIAKYGKQLLENFEKMKYLKAQLEGGVGHLQEDMKHLTIDSNGNEDNYHNHHHHPHHQQFYGYHGQYQQPPDNQQQQQSPQQHAGVVMRAPRISSIESMRSSCDSSSSSSGCMSEQSSVASTPSSSGGGGHSMLPNGHDSSPTSVSSHYMASPQAQNAFDTDYPLGTIKRKPSVSMIMQPKIPLTNTTRNLALQSDDALLEVDSSDENTTNHPGHNNNANYPNGVVHGGHNNNEDDFGGSIYGDFQRFKSGTLLRRSNIDIKSNACKSPSYHSVNGAAAAGLLNTPSHHQRQSSDSSDDLPPPPPSSLLLKEAESTLSLNNNNSFPPPPPPEETGGVTDAMPSPPPPPATVLGSSNSLQQLPQQQQPSSPMHTLLPSVPMTPQPQPKNSAHRLSRRLSDLSPGTANMFMNYRQQQQQQHQQQQPGSFDLMPPPAAVLAPNSRASIATGGGDNYHTGGFATLKAYNTNNRSLNRMQRNTIEAWNKYGTSPRIKALEQQQQQNMLANNGNVNNAQNYEAFHQGNVYGTRNGNYAFPPYGQAEAATDGRFGAQGNNNSFNNFNNPTTSSTTSSVPSQYQQPNTSFVGAANMNAAVGAVRHQECHYMSISPHLLHRHQQMQQQQQQQQSGMQQHQQQQQQQSQFFIRHHQQQQQQQQGSYGAQSLSTMPEQLFLQNMERVMQRKWNVAQMLHKEPTATPGQVLGFRDSAYLPPPPTGAAAAVGPQQQQQAMNFAMSSNGSMVNCNGQQTSSPQTPNGSMVNFNGHTSPQTPNGSMINFNGQTSSQQGVPMMNGNANYHQYMPTDYPPPPPPPAAPSSFFSGTNNPSHGYAPNGTYAPSFNNHNNPAGPFSSGSMSNTNHQAVYARSPGPKSVRIAENATIMGSSSEYNNNNNNIGQPLPPPSPSLSSASSASHYSAGMVKKMPPPPPKRSNSTHLTTGAAAAVLPH